jgi:hypothetical protein
MSKKCADGPGLVENTIIAVICAGLMDLSKI